MIQVEVIVMLKVVVMVMQVELIASECLSTVSMCTVVVHSLTLKRMIVFI